MAAQDLEGGPPRLPAPCGLPACVLAPGSPGEFPDTLAKMQRPSERADQPRGPQATTSSSPAPPPPGLPPDCPVLKAPWRWEELPSGFDCGKPGQEPLPRSADFGLKLSLLGCGHTATARPARHPALGLVCPGCQENDPGWLAWPDGQGGGLQGGRRWFSAH